MDHRQYTHLEIPSRFWSDETGQPFETCMVCGRPLLADGTGYVVEKAMKNYEGYSFSATIYEMAICNHCHQEVQKGMSDESMRNLQAYYQRKMEQKSPQSLYIDLRTFDLENWMAKCFFTGDRISEMPEYQMVAQFEGDKMVITQPPMIIGTVAMNEMAELMSEKTIDDMNDFRNKFMGPSPELEALIYGKKLIML